MTDVRPPKAWLLMAAGDDRQYGGNTGYDDDADVYYSWDDTVKNYGNVLPGDRVALWDKKRLLGISVVESVETNDTIKLAHRCPNPACNRTNINERTTVLPRFKCQICGLEFDEPNTTIKNVVRYVSRHDAAWTPLEAVLTGDELRGLCLSPKSQHSMRELNWGSFSAAIDKAGASDALNRVLGRSPDTSSPTGRSLKIEFAQGHTVALVRVRRGQKKFRADLISTMGGRCAFTGLAPDKVLDAGHLYSYAKLGEHHTHGGLLLRRDIHRLFDDGWLAVNPSTFEVDVSAQLESFPQYAMLHDQPLTVSLELGHEIWLGQHWAEHRS